MTLVDFRWPVAAALFLCRRGIRAHVRCVRAPEPAIPRWLAVRARSCSAETRLRRRGWRARRTGPRAVRRPHGGVSGHSSVRAPRFLDLGLQFSLHRRAAGGHRGVDRQGGRLQDPTAATGRRLHETITASGSCVGELRARSRSSQRRVGGGIVRHPAEVFGLDSGLAQKIFGAFWGRRSTDGGRVAGGDQPYPPSRSASASISLGRKRRGADDGQLEPFAPHAVEDGREFRERGGDSRRADRPRHLLGTRWPSCSAAAAWRASSLSTPCRRCRSSHRVCPRDSLPVWRCSPRHVAAYARREFSAPGRQFVGRLSGAAATVGRFAQTSAPSSSRRSRDAFRSWAS